MNWIRAAVFTVQILFVIALLLVFLEYNQAKDSFNLFFLFLYCFPSEFLISIVPHEPVMLHFAKTYPALAVTGISVAGTVAAEALNYSAFRFISDSDLVQKSKTGKVAARIIDLFGRAPFLVLMIAGITPVPFYPFRFLVVLARYPIGKYLTAIFLSRVPRFYLIVLLGTALDIPDWALLILFVLLAGISGVTIARSH